jgi:DNA polymerase-4
MVQDTLQFRAIVHLDLDAFFAAVEVLENPSLAGKPVIVGGSPEGRGVVASASYPARAYGIHSAMPTSQALRLCPDVVVIRGRHRVYWDYSRRVMAILRESAPLVQQTSVDEAFLDVSHLAAWEAVVLEAYRLQACVRDQVGLSASLGVASNKLVAKVASERGKPGGVTVVRPGDVEAFLAPLSVRVLWGIGPVTARRLAAVNVTTVGELAQVPEEELRKHFGRSGTYMARRARGIDNHPVFTGHEAKSVSHETTFAHDVRDVATLEATLRKLGSSLSRRMRKSDLVASTIAIKLRYADFTTLSRQTTLAAPTDDEQQIHRMVLLLFHRTWKQRQAVRLLGVAARHLSAGSGQLRLL